MILDVQPGEIARGERRFAVHPDGRPASYDVTVVAGRQPGPTALLVGGIHGDEYEGPAAIWRVLARLEPVRLRGRVVAVPVAHAAAFAAGTRASPIDGVNLARIFPGDAGGTITQRLAADLFALALGADLLVDLHSGGVRLAFLQVAGFYDAGDGVSADSAARSRDMAASMRLPFLWRMPGRAGVLSFEAARRGIAVTGCEAGGRGGCAETDVAAYEAGILGVLADHGMIEEQAPPHHYTSFLDGDFALSPAGGFLEPSVALGARVRAGETVARLRAPSGELLATLPADMDGVVMAERHLRAIHAGEWATCVVTERPL